LGKSNYIFNTGIIEQVFQCTNKMILLAKIPRVPTVRPHQTGVRTLWTVRHFGPKTFGHCVFGAEVCTFLRWCQRHQCRSVSDSSALKCTRHFGPRIKIDLCFECVKNVDPLYILYTLMECRCLENDWQKLYRTSLLCVSSCALSATNIHVIGREAEECINCNEQIWHDVYDVSANRGVYWYEDNCD